MTVKDVKLKSESFLSIPYGVLEENPKGEDSTALPSLDRVKMNTIANMFPSKLKEYNDALVHYFVEHKLVVREILKFSSSLKLQCCKLFKVCPKTTCTKF